jgi:vacuolar-type H+-ATPase subunit I/STV1
MELYKAQIIDLIEVLKQTEVADIEGVMQRFSRIQQLEQALAQAQDQIKQLKGDLQTREREAFHAKQSAELAGFKSELDSQAAKAGAATTLYTQRLQDDLKSRKEDDTEMQPLALLSGGDFDGGMPTE